MHRRMVCALALFAPTAWSADRVFPVDESVIATQFVAVPGELEFSGRMIVRPWQPETLRAAGWSDALIAESRKQADAALTGLVVKHYAYVDEYITTLPPGEDESAFATRLMNTGWFEYAHPDWICYPVLTPNDANYGNQWHHSVIQSPVAWNISTGSAALTIGICDTGIDVNHPDLAAKLVPGYNAVADLAQADGGDITDVNGHGTATSGTAAAIGNNGAGVAGVGWNQRIMMCRVTNSSDGSASMGAILAGVRWAATHGARSVSASFSGVQAAAVGTSGTFVKQQGGLLCYAAGNSNTNLSSFDHLDTIVVGATDQSDAKASFSSYGKAVDVAAPGVNIWTTLNGGGYGGVSGTSFSTPMTNGVLSMIWSVNPALSPDTAELLLENSCDDLGVPGDDDVFGHGRINLFRAVQLAQQSLSPVAPVAVNDNAFGFPSVPLTIDVLANDYDINGNLSGIMTFAATSANGGTITRSVGTGLGGRDQLVYTAASGFVGTDSFSYSANDSTGLSTPAQVSVLVDDLSTYLPPDPLTFYTIGLYSYYYDLPADVSVLPNFSSLSWFRRSIQGWVNVPSTSGNYADSGRADNVGAVYVGYLSIPQDARYTFYTESDDGSKLYVSNQLVVNNDGLHGMQERSGQVRLRAGFHKVRVEFFERGGGAGLITRIEGGPFAKQVIRTIYWFRESCDADLNGDGQRDLTDLSRVLANFGRSDQNLTRADGDLNGDFLVDLSDLSLMLADFGQPCP